MIILLYQNLINVILYDAVTGMISVI